MSDPQRILVIKLSALGDFVQAFGPFQAIRRAHPAAHVTLLTTRPFVPLAEASGWFDAVLVDSRPKPWQLGALLDLRKTLRDGRFQRVYDLQTSDRSSGYRRLIGNGRQVEWSGIAPGCSHPHDNPRRDQMHTMDRQAEQLRLAGIAEVPPPDLSWMETDTSRFALEDPYVLLVPGGAPHRPEKRWPGTRYAQLARFLVAGGVTPVVIGTASEAAEAEAVAAISSRAVNLVGKTSLFDIAALARKAAGAVGNDTGPMHLIAAAGCPSVVLYSHASDPALCGQRGPLVDILRREDLGALEEEDVACALDDLRRQRYK